LFDRRVIASPRGREFHGDPVEHRNVKFEAAVTQRELPALLPAIPHAY
jgi:hypothetical protein